MDEILIGEKKYVSSKRAAKVTGYAKDYIGQLCREGRVPARLVGRSWYVLESAIHDHRFGDEKTTEEKEEVKTASSQPVWESPHYETSFVEEDVLPTINRLQDEAIGGSLEEGDSIAQHLQDSWKAWFDRVAAPAPIVEDTVLQEPKTEEEKEIKEEREEEREEKVPVHAIYHQLPVDLLPRRSRERAEPETVSVKEDSYTLEMAATGGDSTKKRGAGIIMSFQIAGVVLAFAFSALAVAGTGYFDKYLISSNQVGLIAGVALYNR